MHADVQASISWSLRVRNAVFQDAHIAIQRKCSCGRIEDWIYIVMGCPQTLEETNITPQTNSRPELEHRYKFRITCSLDFRLRTIRISLFSYQYRPRGGLQCRLGNRILLGISLRKTVHPNPRQYYSHAAKLSRSLRCYQVSQGWGWNRCVYSQPASRWLSRLVG